MAIVINTAPTNNASVSNEMLFVVYEATKANDLVTYPNYKYVLDVYVDDVFVGRMKSTPDPTYKRGVFNVATILRSYTSYGLKANYASATESYTVTVNYKVKLGEEYADTLYTNLTVDSTSRTVYESYSGRPFDSPDVVDNVDGDFASNMPNTVYSHKSLKWQMIPFISNVTGISDFSLDFYNEGSQVGSTHTISAAGYTATRILQLNIGFQKTAALLTTAQKESVTHGFLSGNGETLRIEYVCTRYTPIVLAWLNPYGGYESQSFGLVSKKSIDVTKKDFSKLPYQMDASGVVSYSADGVFYGGKKTYASEVKVKYKLTSHLLTDGEWGWLGDLFISTDVYMYASWLDKFVPVAITSNSYEYKNYLSHKLTPLELEIEFGESYNGQYQ